MTDEIPRSFTASVDRPFDPVSVRLLTSQLFDRNNQRLSEAQVQELTLNPPPAPNRDERINKLSDEANAAAINANEGQKLYNMNLRELGARIANTIHNILDDLVNFNTADGFEGFISIFTKDDRLMFVGMVVILITLAAILFRSGDLASGSCRSSNLNANGCCIHS
jgi:hypothetical protein